jgi:hypothetical protein
MNEGLMKNTSLTAIAVAAGMMLTMGTALAADLGGNCCADLEERIAELEATAAKKGTRKTSLEIYGHVNKILIAWDDGINRNTALGIDNVNHSTRFGFRGNAKIRSDLTAGYSMVIEVATGGRSTNISQFQDKGAASGTSGTANNGYNGGNFGANDQAITMRESNWWLESTSLGRLTVGRFINAAGPQGAIDLGGIGLTVASSSMSLVGSGLRFRTNQANGPVVNSTTANTTGANANNFTGYSIANTTDNAGEYATRENGVMWQSPTLAGFQVTASLAGSVDRDGVTTGNTNLTTGIAGTTGSTPTYGPNWGLGIKYAGEFNGVRVAAAYGHEDDNNANFTSLTGTNGSGIRPHSTNDGVSLSLMHVATGLFAQGFYNEYKRGHDVIALATGTTTAVATGGQNRDTAKQWMVQAGMTKNWFGIGNTSVYGEFGETRNGFNTFGQTGGLINGVNNGGLGYVGDVTKVRMWGIGYVQNIDAAAMELYSGYRNFSLKSDNCTGAGGCKDIGMFISGAKIRF